MKVGFSYDTEDFVTPETDDALKAIARTLRGHGIRASFAMVGDKARALWTRGRKDVIDELKRHDIQYHANTHLLWPCTTLELTRMTWDEGLDLVVRSERHGIEDVAEIFDQRPVAWVRCGGNWDPRELYGMHLLGIRMYLPSRWLQPGERPFWYTNVLNGRYSIHTEHYFKSGGFEAMKRDFLARREQHNPSTLPVVVMAHPCMFATTMFYDTYNQVRRGVYGPKKTWKPAPLLPRREIRRRVGILDAFAGFIASQRDIEIVTHRDAIAAHDEGGRWITRRQLLRLADAVRADFNYQKLGRGYLSAADVFGVLSLALTGWRETGALPPRLAVRRIIGPPEPAAMMRRPARVGVETVAAACAQVEEEIDLRHRMPSFVRIGGRRLAPSVFLMAMADAVRRIAKGGKGTVALAPQPAHPRVQQEWFDEVPVGSSEIPENTDPGQVAVYTHLQCWTVRPAVAAW